MPRARVLSDIDTLLASPHLTLIHIDPQLHADAWALLKAHQDKTWSLVDAASFIVMRHSGLLEALTTDHHFEQARFVRLPAQP